MRHTRPPCPSPTPRIYPNSCPLSWQCHPAISSSVTPFSSCLQSFPASGSFPMSQFFPLGGQSYGASASATVLPMNIQDWFPLGWTGLISLLSKRLSRIFSNITIRKHQCSALFVVQLSHAYGRANRETGMGFKDYLGGHESIVLINLSLHTHAHTHTHYVLGCLVTQLYPTLRPHEL